MAAAAIALRIYSERSGFTARYQKLRPAKNMMLH